MEIITPLIVVVFMSFFAWLQYKQNKHLSELLKKDLQPQVTKTDPNKLGEADEEIIQFDQNNPLDLPKDVKFEVEGGDSFLPSDYEYTEPVTK